MFWFVAYVVCSYILYALFMLLRAYIEGSEFIDQIEEDNTCVMMFFFAPVSLPYMLLYYVVLSVTYVFSNLLATCAKVGDRRFERQADENDEHTQ